MTNTPAEVSPTIDLELLTLRAESAAAEGFHMPLKGSEVLALVAAVKAARAFVDDCPLGQNEFPYVTDICNGKEFRALVAALDKFPVTK